MMRFLRHEVMVVMGGQIVQLAVGVATSTMIARTLQADGYGLVNVLRSIFLMAATISPLGLDAALLKYCGKDSQQNPLVGAVVLRLRVLALALSVFFVACIALSGSLGLLGRVYRYDHADLLFVISFLALPFSTDTAILNAVYRARGLAARYALFGPYLQSALRLVLVPLAAVFSPHVMTFVWINTLQIAVTAVLLFIDLVVRRKPEERRAIAAVPPRESYEGARNVLRESLWMCLSIFVYSLMRSADVMFLGASANAASIGAYTALAMVAQLIVIFPMAASQSLGPAISHAYHNGDRAGVKRELDRYLEKAAPVSGFIFAGLAVFGQRLDLVFGASFHFDAAICFLLPLGQVMSATLAPMGYSLSMTGRHRAENAILTFGGVVLVALCAIFIPRYGTIAAASAVAFSFFLVNVLRYILVVRVIGAAPGAWRDLLPAPVGLVLAYGAAWIGDRIGSRDLLTTFFSCLIYTALFGAIAYKFFLSENLRAALAPYFSKRSKAA